MRVALDRISLLWSDPFPVRPGQHILTLEKGISLKVIVEVVSTSLTVIKLRGLLSIINFLQDHIEIKLIPGPTDEAKVIAGSFDRPLSVLVRSYDTALKVRFFGLFSPWSGEISVQAPPRKSFLVRLPLKEKGRSSTVWCSIITEKHADVAEQVLVLSPMYVLHSQLPGQLLAYLDTDSQRSEVVLTGVDSCAQLSVPCAPEDMFRLSFQVNPDYQPSSPPVSVSWGIVDQVRPASHSHQSIPRLLEEAAAYTRNRLASHSGLKQIAGLKVNDQPGTDCHVKFEEFHPVTNTLRIKVQPRYLIVNQTGMPLLFRVQEEPAWALDMNSVFHPPLLKAGFRFGCLDETGGEWWGPQLELADQDWAYISLLPNFDRIVPMCGSMFYQIRSQGFTLILTMLSEVCDGVRMLTLKPMFTFTSQMGSGVNLEIKVWVSYRKSLSIVYGGRDQDILANQKGILIQGDSRPVMVQHWAQNNQGDGQPEFGLCVRQDGGAAWARPLQLQPDRDQRQCLNLPASEAAGGPLALLVLSHRLDGQVYVVFTADEWPQLRIENKLDVPVVCRESAGLHTVVVSPGEAAYHTMKWLEEGFPYVEQKAGGNLLMFARHSEHPGRTSACFLRFILLLRYRKLF